MAKGDASNKDEFFQRVQDLVRSNSRAFIVNIDNVTSNQMHKIRQCVRNDAVILMGKNTAIRKAIKGIEEEVPEAQQLSNLLRGNVGIVFVKAGADLRSVRDRILSYKIAAPAKVGLTSRVEVTLPAGPTSISPDRTAFFQALGISTKIVKGAIEISADATVVKVGQIINASQVELLNMMGILPFSYGMTLLSVYDSGCVFSSDLLDVTGDQVVSELKEAIRSIACISLATGLPSAAAVPHLIAGEYKKLLSIAIASDVSFPAAEKLKAALAQ